LEKKEKELTIHHGLGEIDRATYELTLEHLTDQMEGVDKELNTVPQKISNLECFLKNSLQKLANICLCGVPAVSIIKERPQKRCFQKVSFMMQKIMNI